MVAVTGYIYMPARFDVQFVANTDYLSSQLNGRATANVEICFMHTIHAIGYMHASIYVGSSCLHFQKAGF